MNMDYISKFVAVDIKYDFIDSVNEPQVTENWVGCRMNIKPLAEISHCIQVFCYPQSYNQVAPYYVFDININGLKFGPAASRTKEFVYGLFWTYESKRCKLFFAFQEEEQFKLYTNYLKELLRTLERSQREQAVSYLNIRPITLNVSINDNLVGCLNNTESIKQKKDESYKSINVSTTRVSDASGIYDELVWPLQDKTNKQLTRPLSMLSGLFVKQTKMNNNGETPTLPPRKPAEASGANYHTRINKLSRQRKSSWNPFRRGRRDERRRSIRMSTKPSKKPAPYDFGSTPTDLGLLNENDINIMEMRTSDILNNLKRDDEPAVQSLQKCNSAPLPTTEPFNISSNILWSHNLSLSCISTANMSNVNLMGANVNEEQIVSDVYIEDDNNQPHQQSIINSSTKGARRRLQFTIPCIDENGYAVMRPIPSKPHDNKSDEPIYCEIIPSEEENASSKCTTQMNEITKNINFQRNFDTKLNDFPLLCTDTETLTISENSDENTSSGFYSDEDEVSYLTPNQSLNSSRSILIEDGILVDFDAFDLPKIPLAVDDIEIESKKVQNCVRPSSTLKKYKKMDVISTPVNNNMNVTASLLNIASESKKNVRKCTPFKLNKHSRLAIFSDKSESCEMLGSCDNQHKNSNEKNLNKNSKKLSRSTLALKKCNEKIKSIFVHNVLSKDTDKTECVESNNIELQKKLLKSIQMDKPNEDNVCKTPVSLSKRLLQKCSTISRKLKFTQYHQPNAILV